MKGSIFISNKILNWKREWYIGVGKGKIEILGASITVLTFQIEIIITIF